MKKNKTRLARRGRIFGSLMLSAALCLSLTPALALAAPQDVADAGASAAADDNEAKVEAAKKKLDAAEAALKEAQSNLADGMWSFYKKMGVDVTAFSQEKIAADNTKAKAESMAMDNVTATIQWMEYCNNIRKGLGLGELKVTMQLMQYAEADCNYSAYRVEHAEVFACGENISWGYANPFDGWYDEEKAVYDKAFADGYYTTMDGKKVPVQQEWKSYGLYQLFEADPTFANMVGHYLNIIDPSYQTTGFALRSSGIYSPVACQTFGGAGGSSGLTKAYTVAEFKSLLEGYNADAKAAVAAAEADVEKARAEYLAVLPIKLSDATVASIADQEFTGKAVTPKPVLTYQGQTLKEGVNYTLTYKNNVNPGTATVVITGAGNCTGTLEKTFVIKAPGAWQQQGGRWWYKFSDGRYPASCWEQIDDVWYHFDAAGWMQTGWLNQGGTWYYLQPSGAMATGWINLGGTWYYLNASGAMATGWAEVDGTWYFLDGSGAMQTGWLNRGGTWYYLAGSGAMVEGWINLGGIWYYLNPGSGAMATGWAKVDGTWYYLNASGAMQTGWLHNGPWYYLTASGAMAEGWINLGGTWYYLNPGSGAMATGWKLVDNTWYYLAGSGAMAANQWIGNYYVGASGAMATSQ